MALDSTPIGIVREGDRIIVATLRGRVEALALEDGASLWRQERDRALAGIALESGNLFALGRRDSLWCWETDEGRLRWSVPITGTHAAPPVAVNGSCLRITYEGRLVRHEPLLGTETGDVPVEGPQVAPPHLGEETNLATVATGGELEIFSSDTLVLLATISVGETAGSGAWSWGPWWVVPTLKGNVRAFTRSRGVSAWGLTFDAPLAEPPVFDEKRVVFVDDRGHVVVYTWENAS
jgi:outer membrane protein assembly factor BamB